MFYESVEELIPNSLIISSSVFPLVSIMQNQQNPTLAKHIPENIQNVPVSPIDVVKELNGTVTAKPRSQLRNAALDEAPPFNSVGNISPR